MHKLRELRDQRGQLVQQGRDLLDKAENEKRELTPEEQTAWDQIIADQDKLRAQIEREERQVELDREMAGRAFERTVGAGHARDQESPAMAAFRSYLRGGLGALNVEEARALQAGLSAEGGFLVAPEEFVNQLIKAVDDAVFIRAMATKFTVPQAASLGVPTLDTDPADADWTTELATGTEDTAMAFGKRELTPHPLAKRIKVSKKLLRASTLPIEQIVMQRLAYKFAISQEKGFMTGSGSNQPLGVFTASTQGITTSRDVSTGNTATSPTFDGLIEAKYTLKGQYWPRAVWVFHRDALKLLAKLKDGEGQYIWRQSVREGEPDMLLGRPFMMSEYAPNTFSANLYVGIFGDFSNYWIADALDMQIQRLVELYAETNQDGFIGRLETDGMPVLAEAFVRVKLASG